MQWPRALRIALWIPPLVVFNDHIGTIQSVAGRSMQPSLNPNSSRFSDLVWVDRTSTSALSAWYRGAFGFRRASFQRGDVVILRSPVDPELRIIKRVVGLPNDMVKTLPPYREKIAFTPEGHLWVEGDESFHSKDSNSFGPVSMGLLEGKVKYVLWPPSRFGSVSPAPQSQRRRVSFSRSTHQHESRS